MYLNFSNIALGADGLPAQPTLRLQSLSGKNFGVITHAYNLKFDIVYTGDVSTIEFEVPYMVNGVVNEIYDKIVGYKVVYTDEYGIYLITSPSISGDGINETKKVEGKSIEKLFERKNLFLEEGTYNFWNPSNPNNTILGRIVETDPTWSVGDVASRLIDCYRTFDQYDDYALSFCYGDAMEKYRCSIVFDPYSRTINAYDASEDRGTIPIYLDYKNLVETVGVEEITEDIVTKLHVYGADDLTIRNVNPIGTDYIFDLSYFIGNGDLDVTIGDEMESLASKVTAWQDAILARQEYYSGIVALRAAKTSEKLMEEAELVDLNSELAALYGKQSAAIQAIALETSEDGKATQQAVLDGINAEIDAKNKEIETQTGLIEGLAATVDAYYETMKEINEELSMSAFFTEEEILILNKFMIEGDLVEETFVATDVNTSVSGSFSTIKTGLSLSSTDVTWTIGDTTTVDTVSGGTLSVPYVGGGDETKSLTASISNAVVETNNETGDFMLTCYLGEITLGDNTYPSGLITVKGLGASRSFTMFSPPIINGVEQSDEWTTTIELSFDTADAYFTANVSDYQKYSVQKDLFDYAAEVLAEESQPLYEFSVDSANFLFHEAFEPFKDALELGKGIHLNLGSMGHITPNMIGVNFEFEDVTSFTMTFSNQFRLKNGVESLADKINGSYSSSRSFDASKYIYNKVADQATVVSKYMNDTLDAAVQTIKAAANQTVTIDGSGIHIGGDPNYNDGKDQLRIVNNMIAMSEDNWQTASLAIGRFASEGVGEVWGVNAEMVAGKLLVGNSLILENPLLDENNNSTGTMQFKVDSTGAWLYNSRIVLQEDSLSEAGGLIIVDPSYGIVGGTNLAFGTVGTTVTPTFLDDHGEITFDDEGMPENANFFLDIRNGNAYIRGTVNAEAGYIGDWKLKDGCLSSGSNNSFVALNAASTGSYPGYAIWAGDENPENAEFWVKKDGSMSATNGTFTGTLEAAKVSGALSGGADSWLVGCGIAVGGDGNEPYDSTNYPFLVDSDGNVTITKGSITLDGTISFGSLDEDAHDAIETAQNDATNAQGAANDAQESADAAAEDVRLLAIGKYAPNVAAVNGESTFISKTTIYAPYISGGTVYGGMFYSTGLGRDGGAAYYIYNGDTQLGYLSYDDEGAGTANEAKERVFLKTTSVPLKIESAGNMSITADGYVYVGSEMTAAEDLNVGGEITAKGGLSVSTGLTLSTAMYGTADPKDAISSPSTGQVYFKLAQ